MRIASLSGAGLALVEGAIPTPKACLAVYNGLARNRSRQGGPLSAINRLPVCPPGRRRQPPGHAVIVHLKVSMVGPLKVSMTAASSGRQRQAAATMKRFRKWSWAGKPSGSWIKNTRVSLVDNAVADVA